MITEEVSYDFKKTKELQEQAINLTPLGMSSVFSRGQASITK